MNKSLSLLEEKEGMGFYVHIPFCSSICTYCDFSKMYYKESWADKYLEALAKEIASYQINQTITTMYIGGGTPSSLSLKQLELLFKILKPYTCKVAEFTIEVNPETMDEEKLQLFKDYGINRLSIGVQTFNEVILKKIGRLHHNQQVFWLVEKAKEVGIEDISIDLMYNLPGQTKADILNDLDIIETLSITHLSYYSLILEEHTILYNEHFKGMDEQTEYALTELIRERLELIGFNRYEVSNFSKVGFESLHNSVYWLNQHYYGFGLGAHGYINTTRYYNTRQFSAYLKGEAKVEEETIDLLTSQFETMMLGLRLASGINLTVFKQRYGIELMEVYGEKLQSFIEKDLLKIEENHLLPSQAGMDLLDFILLEIME